MKIFVEIGLQAVNGKRSIFVDGQLSHHVDEGALDEQLQKARLGAWQSNENEGLQLGSELFRLLNGSGGQLRTLIDHGYREGNPIHLCLQLPFELNALPLELLYENGFLALNSDFHIIRKVNDRNRLKTSTTKKRMLKLLFVACSPTELEDAVLDFEKEEELIQQSVEQLQVDMIIEDSGSLQGLQDALREADGYDAVHLTGHAGVDSELGPVFYMEDNIGQLDKVTPGRLWNELKDYPPRLLFLSGCSTAKSDKLNAVESFAHQMIEKGISMALGWGLPVLDRGAIRFTAELYRYLAQGKPVDFSVMRARQAMKKAYHPWPLLRVFTDGSTPTPLIAPGQKPRRPRRRTTYKHLDEQQVTVLEFGFVGRRREIQQGVRILKGDSEKCGVLIHGPAGIGKSCLAGKLLERCSDKKHLIVHGVLHPYDILRKLSTLFEREGCDSGMQILKSDKEFEDKIKALFRSDFKELPVIFFFDDFEQNLKRHNNEFHLKPDIIETLRPFLSSLEWAEGESNLLLTTRHPFVMEVAGRDLPAETLETISLMSFRGSDLEKKKNELPSLSKSAHAALYLGFGRGNPRLLEWLEKIAEEEDRYNLDGLKTALRGKSEDYIRNYLTDIMARTQGEEFGRFLRESSVYRQPVAQSAFAEIGSKRLLETGVGMTLFEREHLSGQEAVYWVTPVIREAQWAKVPEKRQLGLHQTALDWYKQKIGTKETVDLSELREAIHHALAAGDILAACAYVVPLGQWLRQNFLYKEHVHWQEMVASHLTPQLMAQVIDKKDELIWILLNDLSLGWSELANGGKAVDYSKKALKLAISIFGNADRRVATSHNTLAKALANQGDAEKALEHRAKVLEIDSRLFDKDDPRMATDYANLGGELLEMGYGRKAVLYLEKALTIDLKAYGENHSEVGTDYLNLGDAWLHLGDARKALECGEKGLAIFSEADAKNQPMVAVSHRVLGVAKDDLGDAESAVRHLDQARSISCEVYGRDHPRVATIYNNLGSAWEHLGNRDKSVECHKEALDIKLKLYAAEHPAVGEAYNNYGAALRRQGKAAAAKKYLRKALSILCKAHGTEHQGVAGVFNNLGLAWYDLGDKRKAVDYAAKALSIDLQVLDKDHPSISRDYNNLGVAWGDLEEHQRVVECFENALPIDLKNLGPEHSDVARDYHMLGEAWRRLGNMQKYIDYEGKGLSIELKGLDEACPDPAVGRSFNNLGCALIDLGNTAKALEYLEKARRIGLKTYGENHDNVAMVYKNLGRAHATQGDVEKALAHYGKALAIFQEIGGASHPQVKVLEGCVAILKGSVPKPKLHPSPS